jgi:hypothetical protein
MSPDPQTLISAAAVVIALCYLGWRAVRLVRSKKAGGCGSQCGDCPSSRSDQQVVQIGAKKRP